MNLITIIGSMMIGSIVIYIAACIFAITSIVYSIQAAQLQLLIATAVFIIVEYSLFLLYALFGIRNQLIVMNENKEDVKTW